MTERDWVQEREKAQTFCRENLRECCIEMVELMNTAVLRNGKVRELIRLCSFAHHDAQPVAEAMVKYEAMEAMACTSGAIPYVWAWQHEEDDTRVISAAQKAQSLSDGGASASSVRPYNIALYRGGDGERIA